MTPRWFWLLIAIHLLPIWGVDYFLTQDGPIHIANAWTFIIPCNRTRTH